MKKPRSYHSALFLDNNGAIALFKGRPVAQLTHDRWFIIDVHHFEPRTMARVISYFILENPIIKRYSLKAELNGLWLYEDGKQSLEIFDEIYVRV